MSRIQRGFTIIELMVTLGIVALLVVLAVPAYNDFAIKSKVAECIDNAAVGKLTISEFRQTLGSWPTSIEEAGLDSTGDTKYCAGLINYQPITGAFTIDVDETAVDDNLSGTLAPILTPIETLSLTIIWTCTRGSTNEDNVKYLPPSCRGS